jgi:hypothetical protein
LKNEKAAIAKIGQVAEGCEKPNDEPNWSGMTGSEEKKRSGENGEWE